MENQSTQPGPPSWSPDVGPGKGLASRPRPPWLWLVVIVLLALLFWHFVPKSEIQVPFAPWFLQQVEADNIESLSFYGITAHGVLRQAQTYQGPSSRPPVPVRRFYTVFPSEASIEPVVQKLTRPQHAAPVVIEGQPTDAGGFAWVVLLLPTFVVLGIIYLLMRRTRDRSEGPPSG